MRRTFRLTGVVKVILLLSGVDAAAAQGDQLLLLSSFEPLLATVNLPRGPASESVPESQALEALEVLPDGRVVSIRVSLASGGQPAIQELVEVRDDGSILSIGTFSLAADEIVSDLGKDGEGRLFLLTVGSGTGQKSLIELDAATGEVLRSLGLTMPGLDRARAGLAPAPHGLWVVGDRLYEVDPETGNARDVGQGVEDPRPGHGKVHTWAADSDSTGALWVITEGELDDPPTREVIRFDPATGSLQAMGPVGVQIQPHALAVRRRCVESSTARCLQGGRFRAEVKWTDFEGTTAPARAAPARSADTALFSFFDPANWELLVKVLDSCETDDHFWVFASASTNVGYELRVTDLEADQVRTYENPIGQTAVTVTDTAAFATCP